MGKALDISQQIRSLKRALLLSFMVVFLQFIGTECADADKLIQPENNIVDQGESSDKIKTVTSSDSIVFKKLLSTHSVNELRCLALTIYFEARSESETGQRAVGHVVMNRVADRRYPDSVCEVVHQGGERTRHRCQFSWWCDGQSDEPVNRKAWDKSLRIARKIYFGDLKDTTDGALWYHAVYVKPYWSNILIQGEKIGQHIFYLENQHATKTL